MARSGHDAIVRILLEQENTGAHKAVVHTVGGGHKVTMQVLLGQNDLDADSILLAVMYAGERGYKAIV